MSSTWIGARVARIAGDQGHRCFSRAGFVAAAQAASVAEDAFYDLGEGIAILGSHVYQLTWQNGVGLVYDLDTFAMQRTFEYEGEGWGLTQDGDPARGELGQGRGTQVVGEGGEQLGVGVRADDPGELQAVALLPDVLERERLAVRGVVERHDEVRLRLERGQCVRNGGADLARAEQCMIVLGVTNGDHVVA